MKLTTHFTLEEFTRSDQALRMGINNQLPEALLGNAMEVANMMERIRSYLSEHAHKDIPIEVTSGFRCPVLNAVVGGSPSSDHMRMQAMDFRAPGFGTPQQICLALGPAVVALQIGQLILEYGSWVHVSLVVPDKVQNRIITRTGNGFTVGIA